MMYYEIGIFFQFLNGTMVVTALKSFTITKNCSSFSGISTTLNIFGILLGTAEIAIHFWFYIQFKKTGRLPIEEAKAKYN